MRIEPTIADADIFRVNSYMENMLRIKQDDPKTFAILSPSEKLTLEIYEEQKAKFEAEKKGNNLQQLATTLKRRVASEKV